MNDHPVCFTVYGTPKPQGSKRHVGRGVLVESSNGLKDWRADVTHAGRQAMDGRQPLEGPLTVTLRFSVKKPKSAPKRATRPTTRPDLDKLTRGVFDALTASGVVGDDSQVVRLIASKDYAGHGALEIPGVWVLVTRTDEPKP